MILDKLLEKKDITAYIDNRIKYLNLRLEDELLKHPPEKKEYLRQRHSGKIHELSKLRNIIKTKNIKDISKDYHKKISKI